MTRQVVEQVEIDRCPDCHGIWLDVNELEALIKAKPKELLREDRAFKAEPREAAAALKCPHCKGTPLIKLNSLHRPGTIVDSCTVCYGTWLDAGELARLAGEGLAGRLRRLFVG
jgi:Zn-finger nucleic acid-binding protein